MIVDYRTSDRLYHVHDAALNEIYKPLWCDTETGEVEVLVCGPLGCPVIDANFHFVKARYFARPPLQLTDIGPKHAE
jgi:hypothetical protein